MVVELNEKLLVRIRKTEGGHGTSEAVRRRVGASRSRMSRLLHGARPSPGEAIALAAVLRCEIADIFGVPHMVRIERPEAVAIAKIAGVIDVLTVLCAGPELTDAEKFEVAATVKVLQDRLDQAAAVTVVRKGTDLVGLGDALEQIEQALVTETRETKRVELVATAARLRERLDLDHVERRFGSGDGDDVVQQVRRGTLEKIQR